MRAIHFRAEAQRPAAQLVNFLSLFRLGSTVLGAPLMAAAAAKALQKRGALFLGVPIHKIGHFHASGMTSSAMNSAVIQTHARAPSCDEFHVRNYT